MGRVGSTRKVGAKKERIITCWVQKANERNIEMKQSAG